MVITEYVGVSVSTWLSRIVPKSPVIADRAPFTYPDCQSPGLIEMPLPIRVVTFSSADLNVTPFATKSAALAPKLAPTTLARPAVRTSDSPVVVTALASHVITAPPPAAAVVVVVVVAATVVVVAAAVVVVAAAVVVVGAAVVVVGAAVVVVAAAVVVVGAAVVVVGVPTLACTIWIPDRTAKVESAVTVTVKLDPLTPSNSA